MGDATDACSICDPNGTEGFMALLLRQVSCQQGERGKQERGVQSSHQCPLFREIYSDIPYNGMFRSVHI